MRCEQCGCDTQVLETRENKRVQSRLRRRRRCQACGHLMTTYEMVARDASDRRNDGLHLIGLSPRHVPRLRAAALVLEQMAFAIEEESAMSLSAHVPHPPHRFEPFPWVP